MITDHPGLPRRKFLRIVSAAGICLGTGIPVGMTGSHTDCKSVLHSRGLAAAVSSKADDGAVKTTAAPCGEIWVGLDIGPSKISAFVVERLPDGTATILGVGEAPALGIRDGEVVDSKAATQCIRAALVDAEQKADVMIKSVHLATFGGEDQGGPITFCIQCVNEADVEVENFAPFRPRATTAIAAKAEARIRGALPIDMGAGATSYIVFPDAHAHHPRSS